MTQPPLSVSDQIRSTATPQDEAASHAALALSAPDGASAHVIQSHGVACMGTWLALQEVESARRDAAEKLRDISTVLAVGLRTAATDYAATDHREASNIGGEMHPR